MSGRETGARRLFVFGSGYTGTRFAETLREAGWRAAGTRRSTGGIEALSRRGVEAFRFDTDLPLAEPEHALAETTHLLVSIPPDEEGDPVLRRHFVDLARLPKLGWVGYLGTTAVYGDRGGDWTHEGDALDPTTERARRRVRAEGAWLASGLPVHIFRLAGIYGPGRNPLEQLRGGKARRIVKPGQVFSRIHVDDIVRTLLASIERPNPGAVYNVCDDEPAPPQDVVTFAAELLGIPPPPEQDYATADLSPMARSFYLDNRRVSNARIRRELGVELAFPTYREGLTALVAAEGATTGRG